MSFYTKGNRKSLLDKFVQYLKSDDNSVPLSDKEQEHFDRINYADNLLMRGFTDSEVVNTMKKRYPNLSKRTFYNDCNAARAVHGSVSVMDKVWLKKMLWQMHLKSHALAEAVGDLTNMVRTEALMIKTAGLDKQDDQTLNPDDYGNHNYYLILKNPTNEKQFLQIDMKGISRLPDVEVKMLEEQIAVQFQSENAKMLNGFIDGNTESQ